MIARADSVCVITLPAFSFAGSVNVDYDRKVLEIVGVRYRYADGCVTLTYNRERIRGAGSFEGGTLEIDVRAKIPVSVDGTELTVVGDGEPVCLSIDVAGAPLILAQRVRCTARQDAGVFGPLAARSVMVDLTFPNDGVRAVTEGVLRLSLVGDIADAATIVAVKRGEVSVPMIYDSRAHGTVVVSFGAEVAEAACYTVHLRAAAGVQRFGVTAEVYDADLLCKYESKPIVIAEQPSTVALVADNETTVPLRTTMLVRVEHRGGRLDDAALRISGQNIVETSVPLGVLLPDEVREFPVDVTVTGVTDNDGEALAAAAIVNPSGVVAICDARVPYHAPASVLASMTHSTGARRSDVEIGVKVVNVGFGPAIGYGVQFATEAELIFVADSLRLNDAVISDVNGSWDFERTIELPPIPPGESALLSFAVRSPHATEALIGVTVAGANETAAKLDMRVVVPEYNAELVSARDPLNGSAPVSVQAVRANDEFHAAPVTEEQRSASSMVAAEEVEAENGTAPGVTATVVEGEGQPTLTLLTSEPSRTAEETKLQSAANESGAPTESVVAEADSDREDAEDLLPDGVPKALSPEALELYGDGDVMLGRHVLAVLSVAPEPLAAPVRALMDQYLPGLREDAYALSGHAYDGKALRAALATLMAGAGDSLAPDAPASFVLAHALRHCNLSGPAAEAFAKYRDEVIVATLKAKGDSDFDAVLSCGGLMAA